MIFIHVVGTFWIPFASERKWLASWYVCVFMKQIKEEKQYKLQEIRKARPRPLVHSFSWKRTCDTGRDTQGFWVEALKQYLLKNRQKCPYASVSIRIDLLNLERGGHVLQVMCLWFQYDSKTYEVISSFDKFFGPSFWSKFSPTAWTTGWNGPELASGFHTSTSDVMQRRGDGNLLLWHKLVQALGSTDGPWFCLVFSVYVVLGESIWNFLSESMFNIEKARETYPFKKTHSLPPKDAPNKQKHNFDVRNLGILDLTFPPPAHLPAQSHWSHPCQRSPAW